MVESMLILVDNYLISYNFDIISNQVVRNPGHIVVLYSIETFFFPVQEKWFNSVSLKKL